MAGCYLWKSECTRDTDLSFELIFTKKKLDGSVLLDSGLGIAYPEITILFSRIILHYKDVVMGAVATTKDCILPSLERKVLESVCLDNEIFSSANYEG